MSYSSESAHTIEHANGCAANLYPDEDAMRPDESGDDSLILVHYHRDFHITNDAITEDDARNWYQGKRIPQQTRFHVFPVAAYIHSGVSLSLGSGRHFPDYAWDVSHVGIVLVSKEVWKTKACAYKSAQSLVTEWNQYLSGDVYGIVITDPDGEEIDSCWGYFGHEYAKQEAQAMLDAAAVQYQKEQDEKARAAERLQESLTSWAQTV